MLLTKIKQIFMEEVIVEAPVEEVVEVVEAPVEEVVMPKVSKAKKGTCDNCDGVSQCSVCTPVFSDTFGA